MCAFYLSDVSRGREPNRRLAFGKRLRFLALCSVSILAVTLCRFAIYLKTALCRAAPLTSHFVRQRPFDIANESVNVHQQKRTTDLVVRFLFVTYGAENPTAGWRSAVACKRLRFSVQRTICHCERKNGDPKRYFCTFGEKEYASIRLAIVACDD